MNPKRKGVMDGCRKLKLFIMGLVILRYQPVKTSNQFLEITPFFSNNLLQMGGELLPAASGAIQRNKNASLFTL